MLYEKEKEYSFKNGNTVGIGIFENLKRGISNHVNTYKHFGNKI